jgi:hypothetical protein
MAAHAAAVRRNTIQRASGRNVNPARFLKTAHVDRCQSPFGRALAGREAGGG